MTQDIGIAPTLDEELDRQLGCLLDKGYPELAGRSVDDFVALVEPLRGLLPKAHASTDDAIPLLLVVRSSLVDTVDAVGRFVVRAKAGWTDMAGELAAYRPIEGVEVPDTPVYLLVDVRTGAETLNVRPVDALPMITAAGRTPLTVDEGVALVTQFPTVFDARNAFQVLGSRTTNKRVPSFWMSKGAPRLGWCWAGNPHTWLGAASAAARYAA